MAPAAPPDAMFLKNLTPYEAFGSDLKTVLILSLKAKLRAWVGKYRRQLARLPRQKGSRPAGRISQARQTGNATGRFGKHETKTYAQP